MSEEVKKKPGRPKKVKSEEPKTEVQPTSVEPVRELTEVEMFYISNNKSKSLEEIAKALGVSVELIKEKMPKKELSFFMKQIKDTTDGRNRKGITVMTTGASQVGDESSKVFRQKNKKKEVDYIHKPLGDR